MQTIRQFDIGDEFGLVVKGAKKTVTTAVLMSVVFFSAVNIVRFTTKEGRANAAVSADSRGWGDNSGR